MLNLHRFRLSLIFGFFILVTGCGLLAPIIGPVHQTTASHVDQGKDEGYILFENITGNHSIFLDGTSVGSGEPYTDGKVLAVTPGSHHLEIRENGAVIFQQKVFIGTGSTRKVDIR